MKAKTITGIFALAFMFTVSTMAADVKDGARVKISNPKWGASGFKYVLKQYGTDANGDGIYTIQSTSGPYLEAFKNGTSAGTNVGFSDQGKEAKYKTKWILHKNSTGWSIIHSGNGANTVSVAKDGTLELQRNQGYKHQVFEIK